MPTAGFSSAAPWLPLDRSYPARNVADQREDQTSIYILYRNLIALRHARPSLSAGTYRPIAAEGDLLVFVRTHEHEGMLVALNLGGEPAQVTFPGRGAARVVVLRRPSG